MQTVIGGATVRMGGIAKGSGMIHPNMATMLSVITTDANVSADVWKGIMQRGASNSFNQASTCEYHADAIAGVQEGPEAFLDSSLRASSGFQNLVTASGRSFSKILRAYFCMTKSPDWTGMRGFAAQQTLFLCFLLKLQNGFRMRCHLLQDFDNIAILQISVDGDTSTNDTVLGLASGKAGGEKITDPSSMEGQQLEAAATALLQVWLPHNF